MNSSSVKTYTVLVCKDLTGAQFRCIECFKAFISKFYLMKHYQKRHGPQVPLPQPPHENGRQLLEVTGRLEKAISILEAKTSSLNSTTLRPEDVVTETVRNVDSPLNGDISEHSPRRSSEVRRTVSLFTLRNNCAGEPNVNGWVNERRISREKRTIIDPLLLESVEEMPKKHSSHEDLHNLVVSNPVNQFEPNNLLEPLVQLTSDESQPVNGNIDTGNFPVKHNGSVQVSHNTNISIEPLLIDLIEKRLLVNSSSQTSGVEIQNTCEPSAHGNGQEFSEIPVYHGQHLDPCEHDSISNCSGSSHEYENQRSTRGKDSEPCKDQITTCHGHNGLVEKDIYNDTANQSTQQNSSREIFNETHNFQTLTNDLSPSQITRSLTGPGGDCQGAHRAAEFQTDPAKRSRSHTLQLASPNTESIQIWDKIPQTPDLDQTDISGSCRPEHSTQHTKEAPVLEINGKPHQRMNPSESNKRNANARTDFAATAPHAKYEQFTSSTERGSRVKHSAEYCATKKQILAIVEKCVKDIKAKRKESKSATTGHRKSNEVAFANLREERQQSPGSTSSNIICVGNGHITANSLGILPPFPVMCKDDEPAIDEISGDSYERFMNTFHSGENDDTRENERTLLQHDHQTNLNDQSLDVGFNEDDGIQMPAKHSALNKSDYAVLLLHETSQVQSLIDTLVADLEKWRNVRRGRMSQEIRLLIEKRLSSNLTLLGIQTNAKLLSDSAAATAHFLLTSRRTRSAKVSPSSYFEVLKYAFAKELDRIAKSRTNSSPPKL